MSARHAGPWPTIIQGGMGVAVSSWTMARAVSLAGQLGVVSGTALDVVLARRLQDGDVGGHLRRALAHFPVPAIAQRILDRYLRPGGRPPGQPYLPVPKLNARPSARGSELGTVGAFAEVWLAKEGHDAPVGINLLEKVQLATPSVLYGAMLAGVDVVLMGAGIPTQIPRLLDRLAGHEESSLDLHVDGATTRHGVGFDPRALTGVVLARLRRPRFLAIVSAHVLAAHLVREEVTRPDGFVIEGWRAGGHNAPPRGRMVLDDQGQPVFGPRDDADLAKVADIGLPFWLAGGTGSPEGLRDALRAGATGVQCGSLFALAEESGLDDTLRAQMLAALRAGTLEVRTDPRASPTRFPFKVVSLPGTQSDDAVYAARPRLCDIGHLRTPYERTDGSLGYRCPGEPVATYVEKGGPEAETAGRKCVCNALLAGAGLGQVRRDGYRETALVTLGSDVEGPTRMLAEHPEGWTAADVVAFLLDGSGGVPSSTTPGGPDSAV
ncbi:nitronate monooxygenase [Cellulomonas sp. S1-8]|uniref:nitronate monooxygenase n=1 Tax=Cellulomonas sp. S1-8 TaxID=2904790 RepID=UPI002242E1DD|nr:nitronate monooxygenase [Cellulomonas sp. S1-8]UZN03415.1 nitronate monooxygenase [Cellulomonas sp. S1-8]